MSEQPPAKPAASVDWIAIIALVVAVVSLFVNPYVLVSVLAIVLALVSLVRGNAAVRAGGAMTFRIVAIVALVIAVGGLILTLVSNTINANL
jgi:hypothetical protein